MHEGKQNKSATIRGVLSEVRSIPTQTGTTFAVCKIGEHKCKLFGDLARRILGNQNQYEGQQTEAYGHWDERRGMEFVIDGIGKQSPGSTSKSIIDIRPEKPAMEATERYIVITIPAGVTQEQLRRITDVAKEALCGLETRLGKGVSELANVLVATTDPAQETEDIPF
jgi:hypothetical protein